MWSHHHPALQGAALQAARAVHEMERERRLTRTSFRLRRRSEDLARRGRAPAQTAAEGHSPPRTLFRRTRSVRRTGRGGGRDSNREGAPGGTLSADNVVPPPPSLGGGASASGSGRGARGSGLGGSLDAGSVLAPPAGGGAGGGSAVVISAQPGSKVGRPGNGGAGSLAMSPAGGDKPGLGGSGGGSGIGRGNDTGSGMTGEGPGAAKSGNGRGSDPNARGGISPTAGPGGAGSAPGGTPPRPGVAGNAGGHTR